MQSTVGSENTQENSTNIIRDGLFVIDYIVAAAGFTEKQSRFVSKVAGLLDSHDRPERFFDSDIAKHCDCTERSVRRWRREYLEKAATLNFSPLVVEIGAWDAERQRFLATTYAFPCLPIIVEIVMDAQSQPEYESRRKHVLIEATRRHYRKIPGAPRMRQRFKRSRGGVTADQRLKTARTALGQAVSSIGQHDVPPQCREIIAEIKVLTAEFERIVRETDSQLVQRKNLRGDTGQTCPVGSGPIFEANIVA